MSRIRIAAISAVVALAALATATPAQADPVENASIVSSAVEDVRNVVLIWDW